MNRRKNVDAIEKKPYKKYTGPSKKIEDKKEISIINETYEPISLKKSRS
jgi:hypothetical protein